MSCVPFLLCGHNGNQTQSPTTSGTAATDDRNPVAYEPPPHITQVLIGGVWTTLPAEMTFEEAQSAFPGAVFRSVVLPGKPTTPGGLGSGDPLAPFLGIAAPIIAIADAAISLHEEISAAQGLEADPEYRQALADAEAAQPDIDAFAAMQAELEGILGSGKLNQLTPGQFRQLQDAGIFKNNPATPGRIEPDAPAEVQDSNSWYRLGGHHFIIVEYLGRKVVYEFTTEGRLVQLSSPNYPMMNSYTSYDSVVNLVGDFSLWQSNESIWEFMIEIPTSQFRWGFAEILYSIIPGGASATDIDDGRYGMAGLHFAQDVAETILIFGKLAKLSKFSKLSRLATLGERFNKNSKAAYAAIAVTELLGGGVSGIQAGRDLANGDRKQAAINALQALFGVIGFGTSASAYLEAAEKAAAAAGKLAKSARRLENILDTHSTRKAADLASKPTSVRRIRVLLGRIGMLDSRKVVIRRRAAENYGDHLIDFGSVRRIDGQLLRDRRGRVVIFLTDHSLQSIREAVFTIGHELKHIKDFLAGLENSAEAAANAAGDEFLKQFLNILLRGTK